MLLHRFSPTGFYSSAVKNRFLNELVDRSERQVAFSEAADAASGATRSSPMAAPATASTSRPPTMSGCRVGWREGYTQPMRTPDDTLIFVTPQNAREIRRDQADCMGCLSHCKFSNWTDHGDYTTGRPADPRSFCIQKTLQDIAHGRGAPLEDQLMFAGHNVYQVPRGSLLRQWLRADGEATGAADPDRPLSDGLDTAGS